MRCVVLSVALRVTVVQWDRDSPLVVDRGLTILTQLCVRVSSFVHARGTSAMRSYDVSGGAMSGRIALCFVRIDAGVFRSMQAQE